MPRTQKASTNGHEPTTDIPSPLKGEDLDSKPNSGGEDLDSQMNTNADAPPQVAEAIAERYYGCISEIAPQIAHQFWNQLDRAVAAEILKQRPGASEGETSKFLSGIGENLAQLEYPDATARALVSGGGLCP